MPRRCLVLASTPAFLVPTRQIARISMKLRDTTVTGRASEHGERNRLIITFDRNYGNETANYKKGLQAALDEGKARRLSYDTTTTTTRDNDYARRLSYDFRDS